MDTIVEKNQPSPALNDIYLPQPATLTRVEPMTAVDSFFEVKMDSGKPLGHMPGQFVEVSVTGVGEAPISVSSSPTRPGTFQMVIRRIGNVTQALHRKKVGDKVGIRGPFGTVFPVDTDMKGKNILFVGGGIGLVPLRSAIQYVMDRRKDYGRVIILSGTRSPADRLFASDLEEWKQQNDVMLLETVDQATPGWKGHVGVITSLFPMVKLTGGPWASVICGPPIMYKFVIKELAASAGAQPEYFRVTGTAHEMRGGKVRSLPN